MEILTAYKAEQLVGKYVSVPRSMLASDVDQALNFARYPIVLKLVSKQALHKSDIKGVRFVYTKEDLIKNYGELLKIALKHNIFIEGILVQDFVDGTQVFAGIKKDPTFGHVIGVGLGGVLVEELKDVQWRVCPITEKDAESMIEHLQFKNIIKGTRGTKNNMAALKNALIKLSTMPQRYQNIQEMDVNPVIVNEKSATVVDARIIFE